MIFPYCLILTSNLYALLSLTFTSPWLSMPMILTCKVKVGTVLAATVICALSLCWFVINEV